MLRHDMIGINCHHLIKSVPTDLNISVSRCIT